MSKIGSHRDGLAIGKHRNQSMSNNNVREETSSSQANSSPTSYSDCDLSALQQSVGNQEVLNLLNPSSSSQQKLNQSVSETTSKKPIELPINKEPSHWTGLHVDSGKVEPL
jgi:hypothetical protein